MSHPDEQLVAVVRDKILPQDDRYRIEAYLFVSHALAFGQHRRAQELQAARPNDSDAETEGDDEADEDLQKQMHLSGRELCYIIRDYAWMQYGMLAKAVLNSWGLHSTGDFGEIVFHLIEAEEMWKSENDQRSDFDDVFDFDHAFVADFRVTEDSC